jgi:glutamine synthetase
MADNKQELQAFLDAHPEIEIFEVIIPDVCGGLRGKWITREKIHKVFEGQLKIPLSSLAFDVWGRDGEEWVFDSGDGDGFCDADIRTLVPVPWLDRGTGQVVLSMRDVDGTPCSYDTRFIISNLMARFEALGLTPVMASEMEFYLFRDGQDALGRPLHTQSDALGGALASGQTYGIETMEEMAELMHAVRDACSVQGLPIDTLIKESAPSQYEINLYHCADALVSADQAMMLQRAIKGVARQQGLRATFMAKPFGDLAGNGMHLHCSLVDGEGNNAFDDGTGQGNELLRQAIAGCLATMEESMLLFAPNLNSYRRFQRGTHAPLAPSWGYENRTVAVRVPAPSRCESPRTRPTPRASSTGSRVPTPIPTWSWRQFSRACCTVSTTIWKPLRHWRAMPTSSCRPACRVTGRMRWRASRIRNSSANISARSFARFTRFSSNSGAQCAPYL